MANKDGQMVFIESLTVAIAFSGKTRKTIARESGIHISTLQRILSGKREANISTLFALAEATGTNPVHLIDGTLCKECIRK